jgi:uncharacterized protein YcfJ
MYRIAIILATSLALASCASPEQTAGTTAGAVGGAVVGGPVGAVVGGVAGAVVTAPGGPLEPGRCYVRSSSGEILYHSDGTPRIRRC